MTVPSEIKRELNKTTKDGFYKTHVCFFFVSKATMWPEFEKQCDILHPKTAVFGGGKGKTRLNNTHL